MMRSTLYPIYVSTMLSRRVPSDSFWHCRSAVLQTARAVPTPRVHRAAKTAVALSAKARKAWSRSKELQGHPHHEPEDQRDCTSHRDSGGRRDVRLTNRPVRRGRRADHIDFFGWDDCGRHLERSLLVCVLGASNPVLPPNNCCYEQSHSSPSSGSERSPGTFHQGAERSELPVG